jgi:hypothetical protein
MLSHQDVEVLGTWAGAPNDDDDGPCMLWRLERKKSKQEGTKVMDAS